MNDMKTYTVRIANIEWHDIDNPELPTSIERFEVISEHDPSIMWIKEGYIYTDEYMNFSGDVLEQLEEKYGHRTVYMEDPEVIE